MVLKRGKAKAAHSIRWDRATHLLLRRQEHGPTPGWCPELVQVIPPLWSNRGPAGSVSPKSPVASAGCTFQGSKGLLALLVAVRWAPRGALGTSARAGGTTAVSEPCTHTDGELRGALPAAITGVSRAQRSVTQTCKSKMLGKLRYDFLDRSECLDEASAQFWS